MTSLTAGDVGVGTVVVTSVVALTAAFVAIHLLVASAQVQTAPVAALTYSSAQVRVHAVAAVVAALTEERR